MDPQGAGDATELSGLSVEELATLGREYLLAGHLIDRAGMPQLIARFGLDTMRDVAIDEWMSASPVYTRRMQKALDFEGTDVETIFKGMQLDIGAPPQFMDFRYEVHDADHGEFRLASCGALMDVEPMGDDFVVAMCHHIEDPTFDATAAATNPRARMRPIHRPPRTPADRHPHCHWTVEIEPDADPIPEPKGALRMAGSMAAQLVLPTTDGATDGTSDSTNGSATERGRTDYSGPLQADLRLEDFAPAKLVEVLEETCLQGHLLAMSFVAAVADRSDWDVAAEVGLSQLVGIAGLTADRLRKALGLPDRSGPTPVPGDASESLSDIATVLRLHPAFLPRAYVDLSVEVHEDRLLVTLSDCPALHETVAPSWPMLMATAPGGTKALDAIVGQIDSRARCEQLEGAAGGKAPFTWEVHIGSEAHPEPDEVTLTRFSTGADFQFQKR